MCRLLCVLTLVALFIGLVQSWDIAVTAGDRLEFYTINGTKTSTVHFDSRNLTALTYNEVHNMLLFVDKQSDHDAICGYNISSVEHKCYVKRNGKNIQGLAFDPVTESLFFTDTKDRSINSISFKLGSKNNTSGNLLIQMDEGIPTDIAVDSCRGYIYWINTNLTKSSIERARFDGSEREIVFNSTFKFNLHSLVIGQQTQKIYWIMPDKSTSHHIVSADLNGKNLKYLIQKGYDDVETFKKHPNTLTISKDYLFMVTLCSSCNFKPIWKFPKPSIQTNNYTRFMVVDTKSAVGLTANYKLQSQILGVKACASLISPANLIKKAKEYEGPFCVNGTKANEQSLCKCKTGYTGERCDVSVCVNYCLQGNCTFNDDGLPICRCKAGYSGERCEVNVCHGYCSNNGTCSLNDESEAVCRCIEDYTGDRCEVSDCVNYCLQGNCSYNEVGLPICRCKTGYSGERCEVNVCHGYCSNNGTCSLNDESEPVCRCIEDYTGDRCEVSDCVNYCLQGNCSYNEVGLPICRCNTGYSGERCEVNVCHGYCSNNGTCSLNDESEPVCRCVEDYTGDRCEVSDCLNYCLQGNCSYNEVGLPICRCNTGYSGERCEINVCLGYCSNQGVCSINEENDPVCQCTKDYVGNRCDDAVSSNTIDFPQSERNEPVCQCKDSENKMNSTVPIYYMVDRNMTLADFLMILRKPVATIHVLSEVNQEVS